MKEFAKNFRQAIELLQKDIGSQAFMAKKMNMLPQSLNNIMLERAHPTIHHVCILSLTYGISADWLITGEGPMFRDSKRLIAGARPQQPKKPKRPGSKLTRPTERSQRHARKSYSLPKKTRCSKRPTPSSASNSSQRSNSSTERIKKTETSPRDRASMQGLGLAFFASFTIIQNGTFYVFVTRQWIDKCKLGCNVGVS